MLCHEEYCPEGMSPHWHGNQLYNEELAPPPRPWREGYPQDPCPQLVSEGSTDVAHRCLKVYKRPWRRLFRKTYFWVCYRCGCYWQTTGTAF